MGQVTSVAAPHPDVKQFTNLPKDAILSVWLSYNLLGEGWALSLDQFVSIFKEASALQEAYAFSDDQLCRLFYAFDTDQNGLVDALEAIATIGMMSGMDAIDKVNFTFTAFDFEGKGSLSKDETSLLFRSLIKGLQKASPYTTAYKEAKTNDPDKFANLAFSGVGRDPWYGRTTIDEFQGYCVTNPVVSSWLKSVAGADSSEKPLDAGIKDPALRNEWISVLEDVFAVNSKGRVAKQHLLSLDDIKLELEKSSAEELPLDTSVVPWYRKAQLLKPEEPPAPQRWDLPEDIIDSTWINGINSRRVLKLSKAGSLVEDFIHRSIRYKNTDCDTLIFTSGSNLIVMKKNEETSQWIQEMKNAHDKAISAFDLNYDKDIVVTAENDSEQEGGDSYLIVWKLSTLTVKRRIKCPSGVKFLDLSTNGSLVLVVFEDKLNTLSILNLETGLVVFSKQLLVNNALGDRITDVKFFGTASMFAVSSSVLGMRIFVNEESGLMGKDGMKLYEERSALYGSVGKEMRGSPVISLSRLDAVDEMVCGLENGGLILWRGRTASQVMQVHRSAVLALDFDTDSKTLATGGSDGSVSLFEINDGVDPSAAPAKKGLKAVASRVLKQTASFDIFRHPLQGHVICSLALSKSSNKALVLTASNEIIEVRCKLNIPSPSDVEEAAAEEEGGEGILANKGQLGDDLHGGAILSSHYLSDDSIKELLPSILTTIRAPSGGFITAGSDKTVRIWSLVGDGESSNAYKATKIISLDCPATCLAATASVLFVAQGATDSARTGTIQMFSLPEGNILGEITELKSAFSLLQVSSEGNLIAGANSDGSVYFFSQVEGAWNLKGSVGLGNAPESMDLSADNQFVRCYIAHSQDLLVYDIGANFGKEMFSSIMDLQVDAPKPVTINEDGEEVEGEAPPNPAAPLIEAVRGITWASQSCPYSFDCAGVRALYSVEPTFARIFDRSNSLLLDNTYRGAVGVSRVPSYALPGKNVPKKIPAHVGPLSGLIFIEEGGSKLVTIGALDGALRIWKVAYDTDEPEPDLPDPTPEEAEAAPPADEEEGKAVMPTLYDSGEEDDKIDGPDLRKHLPLVIPEKKLLNEEEAALSSAHLPQVLAGFSKTLGFSNTIELEQAACRMFSTDRCPVPNDEVQLHWVYGCSSRQTRNAVRYSAEGSIVYPAGTVCVIFDKIGKTQKHVFPHKDEITCLDIHLGKKIGISAHKGAGNIFMHVWRSQDGYLIRSIDCGAVGGLSAVKFSPDGNIIAVACQDSDHTIKLFSSEDGALLASIIGGSNKVLCLAFSELPVTPGPVWRILQGGAKHFRIISYNVSTRAITYKTGGYGADVRKANVICASSVPMVVGEDGTASGNEFLLGLSDGTLAYLGRGENKIGAFTPTLTGPVNALYIAKLKEATAEEPAQVKVVVAGTNGIIKMLDQELQPEREWNLYAKDYGLYQLGRVRGFKSICCDKLNRKILYSTSAGEIGEIDFATGENVNAGPIVSGHFRDKLSAMVSHPLRQECVSAGEDKTLRVWDLETHSVIAVLELPGPALCTAVSPNGHLIVVGLGPKDDENVLGRMAVVSYLQGKLRLVHVATEARDVITSVAFSPDGSKAFAACMDTVIYVYDALNNFIISTTLVGHNHGVRSMSIAANGRYAFSQSVKDDAIVWDLASFTAITRPRDRFEALADVEANWSTRQTLLGVNSLGIFPDNNSIDYLLSLAQSKDTKLVAVGDQKGLLKIYTGPSVKCYAPYKNFSLHSAGGLSQISFSVDDAYILTTGLHDKVVAQWKVVKSSVPHDSPEPTSSAVEPTKPDDIFENAFVVKGVDFRKDDRQISQHGDMLAQLTNIIGVGNKSNGNKNYAVFCGHGEVLTVLGKTLTAVEEDGKKLRLWNYNPLQSVSVEESTRHTICCIDASLSGRYVLAGCDGPADAPLYLFYSPTGQLCIELNSTVTKGVAAVAMAMNDLTAACVGKDAFNTLYVFKTFNGQWDDALMIYKGQTSDAKINFLTFSNIRTVVGSTASASDFVTAGKGRIRFWKIDGLNALSTCGNYEAEEPSEITALARGVAAHITITGDVTGRVLAWDGNVATTVKTMDPPISAIAAFGGMGSDKEGVVVGAVNCLAFIQYQASYWYTVWQVTISNLYYEMGWTGDLYLSNKPYTVMSIQSDISCKQLLLSMNNGSLFSMSTDSQSMRRLLEGQANGATVTDILSHPGDHNTLLTIGNDSTIRFWDISEVSVITGVDITGKCSALKTNPVSCITGFSLFNHPPTAAIFLNENHLLVSVKDADASNGSAAIFIMYVTKDASGRFDLSTVHRIHNIGKGRINKLQLSPGNKYLAACSDDGCVYIYEVLPVPNALNEDEEGYEETKNNPDLAPGIGIFSPIGFLLAHPSGAPCMSVDFSEDNRYARTFGANQASSNGKVEVNYFDFQLSSAPSGDGKAKRHAAGKIQDVGELETLRSVSWASVSSQAAPEARGVGYPADSPDPSLPLAAFSVAVSADQQLICGGYEDGSIRVFKYPVPSKFDPASSGTALRLQYHRAGPVLVKFTPYEGGQYRLVTVGQEDGCLMAWTLQT